MVEHESALPYGQDKSNITLGSAVHVMSRLDFKFNCQITSTGISIDFTKTCVTTATTALRAV